MAEKKVFLELPRTIYTAEDYRKYRRLVASAVVESDQVRPSVLFPLICVLVVGACAVGIVYLLSS